MVVGEGLGSFLGVACFSFVGVCLGLVGVGCAHGRSIKDLKKALKSGSCSMESMML